MFTLELYNALWLFVVIFMLHDFEEIIVVEKWSMRTESKIKDTNSWMIKQVWKFWNINSYSFAKRDVFIFLTISTITFIKNITLDSSWSSTLYLSFLIFVLVHNIAHILQTFLLKTYTPGLYTSILLVSPYTIYLLIRLLS
ncbi:HXXEE domain-containing protein [Bacillus sp. NEB1478]|uniref:HXXEE domain-containing protein n=1 Tax=Bacillus sp. NEB1478 TaxID=3073816 RepID=UPI00287376A6|nr:HXXEE domain-containing protein [Bacillus sp. NEB1478]WNB92123.1 HXXEE domain-containing protein [Bacillus sp. NEB1478]